MSIITKTINSLKQGVIFSLYHCKVYDALRHIQKNRVTILMYHRFSGKDEPFKVSQNVFENQVKFIKRGYNFISLKHYSEILNKQRIDCPDNPAIITIDDGYWDNYAFAYPVLNKYSIPATIFLTTDFINYKAWLWSNKLEYILKNSKLDKFDYPMNGKSEQLKVDNFKNWHKSQLKIFNYCCVLREDEKNEYLTSLAEHLKVKIPCQAIDDFVPLTWEQIREMNKNGIDFGSHSRSHPILSRLNNEQLEYELIQSKKEIENKVDANVDCFAYPNGGIEDFNDTTIDVLKNNSYSCAVTTIPGYNQLKKQDPFMLKRISVTKDDKKDISKKLTS